MNNLVASEPIGERTHQLAKHYKEILNILGENPQREGLLKTPVRVAKAMEFLTAGYSVDPGEIIKSATFKEDYRQMVIVKDIDFFRFANTTCSPFMAKHTWPIFRTDTSQD